MGKRKPSINLNIPSPELEKILSETSKPALLAAGRDVAASIKNVPVKVTVANNRKGRAVVFVTITHPKGLAMQAKHGTLTRGAAFAGLEVKRYRI